MQVLRGPQKEAEEEGQEEKEIILAVYAAVQGLQDLRGLFFAAGFPRLVYHYKDAGVYAVEYPFCPRKDRANQ